MERQLSAWLRIADRYLPWIEILAEKTEEEVAGLGPDALLAFRQALSSRAFASRSRQRAHRLYPDPPVDPGACAPAAAGPLSDWIDRVLQAFEKSKWLAGEMLGSGERLIQRRSRAIRIDQHALPV